MKINKLCQDNLKIVARHGSRVAWFVLDGKKFILCASAA